MPPRQLNCTFTDTDGSRVPVGTKVYANFQHDDPNYLIRFTAPVVEEDGRLIFRFASDVANGGANVEVMIAGGKVWRGRQIVPPPDKPVDEGFTIQLWKEKGLDNPFDPAPGGQELPELSIDGQFFLAGGQPITLIDRSEFSLFARWSRGEDTDPVMAQRQALGYNMARVWTKMMLKWAGIDDLPHPDYSRIPEFVRYCAGWGSYVHFTAYTGLNDGPTWTHWYSLRDACLDCTPRPLLSRVNENDVHNNAVDVLAMHGTPGLLTSRGSNGSGSYTVLPVDLWGEYHANGQFEWQRKAGHNAMEIANDAGVPVGCSEATRFPDNDQSLAHAEDAAAGAALLCAFYTFHSVRGKSSQLWDGLELDAATASARGALSVPTKYQRGLYVRRDDLLTPGLIRVYQRVLAGGDAWTVEIRA